MSVSRAVARRLLFAVLVSGLVSTGWPAATQAQRGSGLTIFSGVDRENVLPYRMDFGGKSGGWDRYRLFIPRKQMANGVSHFIVSFPDYYEGTLDLDRIEVRIDDEPQPIESIEVSERQVSEEEFREELTILLEQPLEPDQRVEIVFSNVKNPRIGKTYYVHCLVQVPNDVRRDRYLGTWIVTID